MRTNLKLPAFDSVRACALSLAALFSDTSSGADQELLDILLKNGVINKQQHEALAQKGVESGESGLLEILQKNGAITKDQYASLSKKPTTLTRLRLRPTRRGLVMLAGSAVPVW